MLKSLVEAQSLAVLGASDDASRIGGRPIAYTLRNGFKGRIYPVNPKRDRVQGLRAYPSLADLPETVDVVIVAVPRQYVREAIKGAKVRNYIMFSAGYGEVSAEGKAEQEALARQIREQGGRMLGPNCLGLVSRSTGLVASFTPTFENLPAGPASNIVILTQSGAFGSYMYSLAMDAGLTVQEYVSTGNEGDVTVDDMIEYYAERPDIKVIAAQFEGVRPGQFRKALERIDACGKMLVVCKAGRTQAGARAAASHTGSLVGSDAAFDAMLRGHRAVRRQSADEIVDMISAAALGAVPAGRRIGLCSVSGGSAVLMADEAIELGLELPDISEKAKQTMRERVEFCTPANPLDMTGQVMNDAKLVEEAVGSLLESEDFDSVALYLGAGARDRTLGERWLNSLKLLRPRAKVPFFLSGLSEPDFRDELRALGIPIYRDPVRMIRTIAGLAAASRPLPSGGEWTRPAAAGEPESADEYGLKRYFEKNGLKVPQGRRAASQAQAVEAAETLGFPVVMKLSGSALQHKSDIGGVVLGIRSREEASKAAERLDAAAKKAQLADAAFLVEKQVEPGAELIVSLKKDPIYGSLLVIGLGGVFTEVLRDAAVEVLPSSDTRLEHALRQLRGWPLLEGYRGGARVDPGVIVSGIREIARAAEPLLDGGRYSEIEMNPVFVRPDGLWIADAVAYQGETSK